MIAFCTNAFDGVTLAQVLVDLVFSTLGFALGVFLAPFIGRGHRG